MRNLLGEGEEVVVTSPGARHNLGVALLEPGTVTFDGSVGYYCGGLSDGATIRVKGSAGWGLAESMLDGEVTAEGNAGNSAGAAMRGGTVVIHGDSGARTGVSMKGGLIVVGGNCGYMSGFMGQKGTMIICGETGEGFADSMYETVCFVGGQIRELGNDTVVSEPSEEDIQFLAGALDRHLPAPIPASVPDCGPKMHTSRATSSSCAATLYPTQGCCIRPAPNSNGTKLRARFSPGTCRRT